VPGQPRPLPVAATAEEPVQACCAACAAGSDRARAPTPVRRSDRDIDRRITAVSLAIAGMFVALGLGGALIGALTGAGAWVPLHLVSAGAAGTAIAGVLPFFTTALAAAPPADPRARSIAVGLVVAGALLGVAAIGGGAPRIGHIGGGVYIVGVLLVGVVAFRPLRGALGQRRRPIERSYAAGLLAAVVGVALATTMLAGWAPVVERWATLKPAHVWLDLIGFLSLTIVATLMHLAPTVEGSRIRPRPAARVALIGVGAGAALVALGYAIPLDAVARAGGAIALVGALAVPVHAIAVRTAASPWTTDLGWHRLVTWSVRAASGWFLLSMVVMAGRVMWLGADPRAWSLELVGVPFVIGWVVQILVGSWSHVIPALHPGGPPARAAARDVLGRVSWIRLAALNGGVLVAWIGIVLSMPWIFLAGASVTGLAVALSIGLAVAAVWPSRAPGTRRIEGR
jgi:hypothetical protein